MGGEGWWSIYILNAGWGTFCPFIQYTAPSIMFDIVWPFTSSRTSSTPATNADASERSAAATGGNTIVAQQPTNRNVAAMMNSSAPASKEDGEQQVDAQERLRGGCIPCPDGGW